MLVIDSIRLRDHLLVKALGLPCLVSTDEQDRYSLGPKAKKMRLVCVTRNSFMLECREPSYRVDQWPAGGRPQLLRLANDHPLKKRLRAALDQDDVPISKAEFAKLWKLRKPRNRSVHGKAARVINEGELESPCSLLCRALVFRLGKKLGDSIK
jgi:hypothetical protein